MTRAPIRVALLGYGYAGRTFHAPLIGAVPGLQLRVIGSSRAQQVQAELGDIEVVPVQDAALHPEVDLVVIATPNDTHAPLARTALEAGKHVVVDKPFTVTLAEARELTALAEQRGRLLSVFHNRRWDADFLAAQRLVRDGTLGEILHFESHFDRFRPQVRDRWREQTGSGTGIWYDLGPHLVDQALCLFGLPQRVSAQFARQRPGATVDDWAHVVLDYGRLQVILHASMLAAGVGPRFVVHGTRGSWVKQGLDPQEAQLLAGLRPGMESWGVDTQASLLYNGRGETEPMALPIGDQAQYYRGLLAALCTDGPNPVAPAEVVAVMAVIDAAVRSALTGRVQLLALNLDANFGAARG